MASGKINAGIKYKDVQANIVKNGGNIQSCNPGLSSNQRLISAFPIYSNDYYYATSAGLFDLCINGNQIGIRTIASDNWTITIRVAYI